MGGRIVVKNHSEALKTTTTSLQQMLIFDYSLRKFYLQQFLVNKTMSWLLGRQTGFQPSDK